MGKMDVWHLETSKYITIIIYRTSYEKYVIHGGYNIYILAVN